MLWLVGFCAIALTLPRYDFEDLVEESTVVVYGFFPNSDGNNLEIFDVLAGALSAPASTSIEVRASEDHYYTDPKRGRGIYFIRQCEDVSEIAGNGQGVYGILDGKFQIKFPSGERSPPRSVAEISEIIRSSERLGLRVKCP